MEQIDMAMRDHPHGRRRLFRTCQSIRQYGIARRCWRRNEGANIRSLWIAQLAIEHIRQEVRLPPSGRRSQPGPPDRLRSMGSLSDRSGGCSSEPVNERVPRAIALECARRQAQRPSTIRRRGRGDCQLPLRYRQAPATDRRMRAESLIPHASNPRGWDSAPTAGDSLRPSTARGLCSSLMVEVTMRHRERR